ncbi:MAG: hypothetical protein HYX45_12600 [Burkholderiales bacterium]|nr:hypothetical protein [Burkholderiales bacterium]
MKYSKTDVGQQAFKERSPQLSARQRSAFILFDGSKTVDQVLAATAGLGVTPADVEHMVAQGFLAADPSAVAAAEAATVAATARSARTPQERYAEAYPLATQLTASLGLRGFKLNLAIEGAAGYDDLLALLPKIREAVGQEASRKLEQALLG